MRLPVVRTEPQPAAPRRPACFAGCGAKPSSVTIVRVFAYACCDVDPPVRRGLLPLSELTILLGPNDSGKSSWLLRRA
jgi:hypothetical protein